jgi:predicted DNA-binding protein YlxM (UPF0122 family)
MDEKERVQVIASLEKVVAALEQYEAKLAIKDAQAASKIVKKQKDNKVGV